MTTLLAARPAIVRALAASVGLTAAWGLVSGITQYHFAYACLAVGFVLARTLTKTPAPRTALLPAIAAVLAFAVGFVGDFAAVVVALWLHYGIPAGVIFDHSGELFSNVAGGHSVTDWVFFLLAAIAAAGMTAGRQVNEIESRAEADPARNQTAS
ncbi:hypothetical protein GCM10009839_46660 [Catenulispora yoronensis]|uniref:DUF4118 domain-containing protein n=1 Tax=Catenulispora yoronensis TaxID=450799 RepID=A0ABN2UMP7_9ACTN